MSQTFINNNREEWLKVLGKGMVTLPKKWREELGIETGGVVKAKREGDKVIIEAQEVGKKAPYRIYSDAEIDEFLKEDVLPGSLAKKARDNISSTSEK